MTLLCMHHRADPETPLFLPSPFVRNRGKGEIIIETSRTVVVEEIRKLERQLTALLTPSQHNETNVLVIGPLLIHLF